jgi:hypothetical protein
MRDSLAQLTLVRFREFFREPDAVFWTFAFPILLASGLGIAFRHRPPELLHVGVRVPAGATAAPPLLAALRRQRPAHRTDRPADRPLRRYRRRRARRVPVR